MSHIIWKVVKEIRCQRVGAAAELLEERVYFDDPFPEVGPTYRVRARKCALGMECNLAGHACCWARTNPNYDPFVE